MRKGRRKPGRQRLRTVALGLAKGLSQVEAVKQAGYADSTAEKLAYQIVRRPQIQSFLTEALEELGVTAKQIMRPIKDGLEACEVVRTEKGKILTDHPDHKTRLAAHDRAVELYGLKGKHADAGDGDGPPIPPLNLQINFVSPKPRDPERTMPRVRFVPSGPR